ncbi:MAG: hypothetical protein OEM52_05370 [bacterium]|nr:hypothetical protein [bacterium]
MKPLNQTSSVNQFATLLVLILMMALVSTIAFAEEPDLFADDEWDKPMGHPGFFAGGGFLATTMSPDLSNINAELKKAGMPNLASTFVCYGGNGFGTIKNFRIGGFGFGGATSSVATVPDTNASGAAISLNKKAEFSIGSGGIITGYRITLPNSFELEPSLWLGIATMTLNVVQSSGDPEWNAMWNGMQNYSSSTTSDYHQISMNSIYFYAQPGVFIRYYFKPWAAVALGGQYSVPVTQPDDWSFWGKKITNAKSVNAAAPSFTFQFSLGM